MACLSPRNPAANFSRVFRRPAARPRGRGIELVLPRVLRVHRRRAVACGAGLGRIVVHRFSLTPMRLSPSHVRSSPHGHWVGAKPRVELGRPDARAEPDVRAEPRRDLDREHVTLPLRVDGQADRGQVVGADPRDARRTSQQDPVAEVVHVRVRPVPLGAEPVAGAGVQGRGVDRPGVDHRVADEDVAARRPADRDARGDRR